MVAPFGTVVQQIRDARGPHFARMSLVHAPHGVVKEGPVRGAQKKRKTNAIIFGDGHDLENCTLKEFILAKCNLENSTLGEFILWRAAFRRRAQQ